MTVGQVAFTCQHLCPLVCGLQDAKHEPMLRQRPLKVCTLMCDETLLKLPADAKNTAMLCYRPLQARRPMWTDTFARAANMSKMYPYYFIGY